MTTASWKYKTVALRIEILEGSVSVDEPTATPSATFSASGVFLVAAGSSYILSVSPVLTSLIRQQGFGTAPPFRVLVALSPDTFTDDAVHWYPVDSVVGRALSDFNDTMRPFVTSEYEIVPKNHQATAEQQLFLAVLKPSALLLGHISPKKWPAIDFWDDPRDIASNSGTTRIRVESSPFVLVNPILFSNYTSTGTASYLATPAASKGQRANLTALFSDARYLDGMEGGPVFYESSRHCIGLVAGCLYKKSGQGDLLTIVPWSGVRAVLEKMAPGNNKLLHQRSTSATPDTSAIDSHSWLAFNGVLLLEVQHDHTRQSWGSGILLEHGDIVVTNSHMVESGYRRVTAWVSQTRSVELTEIGNPLPGIDIMFFKVNWDGSKPEGVHAAELYRGTTYKHGQEIYSMGYGLIYPRMAGGHRLPIQPMRSAGTVSNVVELPLLEGEEARTPVMLVSSACCWNGSSGGAVFDARTEAVVALMTSNGRVNETGQVIPQMAFTLPAAVIRRALAMLHGKEQPASIVNPKVVLLWQLKETHESLMAVDDEDEDTSMKAKL